MQLAGMGEEEEGAVGSNTNSKALFVIMEVSLLHELIHLTAYYPDHLVATILAIITVICIIFSDMHTFSYHKHAPLFHLQ